LCLGIGQLFENLIDRELQFRARAIKSLIGLRAQVDVEALKDFGCRWMRGNDFADGLC
jgi:hypothetical protein